MKYWCYRRAWLNLVITLVLLVSAPRAFSANSWSWQNPKPQGNNLQAAFAFSRSEVIAVGAGATIVRTTDEGATWSVQFEGGQNAPTLRAVTFVNDSLGWAVGDDGYMLETHDGGEQWSVSDKPHTSNSLYAIGFANESVGWIGGENGTILKTTNGGGTWLPQPTLTTQDLHSLYVLDEPTCWLAGDSGTVISTRNGGITWGRMLLQGKRNLYAVYLRNASSIWVAGDRGFIARSTNAGAVWKDTTLPAVKIVALRAAGAGQVVGLVQGVLAFRSGSTVIAWNGEKIHQGDLLETWNGGFIQSADSGKSWKTGLIDSSYTFADMVLAEQGSIWWVVGTGGAISLTATSGRTWTATTSGVISILNGILMIDSLNVWAVGQNGAILHTTDGGNHWTGVESHTNQVLNAVAFPTPNAGYVAGNSGTILRTTDGGASWIAVPRQSWSQSGVDTTTQLLGLDFVDSLFGIVVGTNGRILLTTDGARSWTRQDVDTNAMLNSICLLDRHTGWIAATSERYIISRVFKTVDGGISWSGSDFLSGALESITFVNATYGWAVGKPTTIVKTTDGGVTWRPEQSPVAASFYGVHFVDPLHGWICGSTGTVLRTNDGGSSWASLSTGTPNDLHGTCFIDTLHGWVTGFNGTILQTTDGGGAGVKLPPPSLPVVIQLMQNYPNPFNPGTVIPIDVLQAPVSGSVTIYDILGRRIKEFLFSYSGVGRHNDIVWDGRDEKGNRVSAGIYFYQLEIPEFSVAQKMVLVK
ncbi:MAG: YCF48-related protein [Bacteroidota bacterium]|jgi:photosystem II stability/assembly factor-like uncharacterized protein